MLGLHFFAPANIMKLLEVVRGKATSPQTLTTGLALGKKLRKVAVVSGNAFGFIGNRMLFEYEAQAVQLAEEGVSPARIDNVMKKTFGFAMGPFAVADLSGLDVYHFISQSEHGQPLGRIPIVAKLVEQGRLGQKSGAGFFRYDKAVGKGREAIPDPEVESLIAQLAREAGHRAEPERHRRGDHRAVHARALRVRRRARADRHRAAPGRRRHRLDLRLRLSAAPRRADVVRRA